jgi:hypothetical protein
MEGVPAGFGTLTVSMGASDSFAYNLLTVRPGPWYVRQEHNI